MKTVLQNFIFLLRKFKAASILNILGLSAAFAVAIVVAIQVWYDFSFDRSYKNSNEIYYMTYHSTITENSDIRINQFYGFGVAEKTPEIKAVAILSRGWPRAFMVRNHNGGEEFMHHIGVSEVSPGFLEVFTPEIVMGDTTRIFSDPGKALISERAARRIFGGDDPVGKELKPSGHDMQLTVAAVYKDFPRNSSVNSDVFTRLQESGQGEWSYEAFYLIDPRDRSAIEDKVNQKSFHAALSPGSSESDQELSMLFKLWPQKDRHLYDPAKMNKGTARVNTTLSMLGMGILVLAIALINFVNFSISMAPARVRTINIRKIFGATRGVIRVHIATEALMLGIFSFLLSLLYVFLFSTSSQASLFEADMSMGSNIIIILIMALFVLLLSFATGIYTGRYSTSFESTVSLRGNFTHSRSQSIFRNILITVQFTASIALICIAWFIKIQHDYMNSLSWGLQKENVAYLDVGETGINKTTFGQELKQNSEILDYSGSRFLPGVVSMGWGRTFLDTEIEGLSIWEVDPTFLNFFGINIVAGEGFRPDDSEENVIVFNRLFLEKYGFDESLIGKAFPGFTQEDIRIVGISDNVNFQSLHHSVKEMAFFVPDAERRQWASRYMFLKVSGNNIPATIDYIRNAWEQRTDHPFEIHFLDDHMESLYQREGNTARLIGIIGIITVIIGIMGLYGLILFNIRHKTKEIGIRKVNGASEMNIVFMLNRNFLILLGIAFVIAVPLSIGVISRWVTAFAYKSPIPWWLFPAAGIIILVISVIAIGWQSWKAAVTNPVDALKTE